MPAHFRLSKRWNSGTWESERDALHTGQSCYQQREWDFKKKGRTEDVFRICLFLRHHNFVLNLPRVKGA